MPGKKHSILLVIVIIGATAVFLGLIMALIITKFGPSVSLSVGNKIGVIPIEGTITDSAPVLSQLNNFKKDNGIKAIILRIDSPGGGVGPSQEIYREVRRTIKTKKIIASMGSLAASGGYYIAAGADKIVANPGTITGSIGVIMEFIRIEELLQKIGVGREVLKSGEFKDIGSPHRQMSEREKELLTTLISDVQRQFVAAVALGRNLSVSAVKEIADGRILTGAQAKELGLVDALGNFRDAVDLAKKMTGIEGEVTLVYPKGPRRKLWDFIIDESTEALLGRIRTNPGPYLEYRWNGRLPN
jgi:protease-4